MKTEAQMHLERTIESYTDDLQVRILKIEGQIKEIRKGQTLPIASVDSQRELLMSYEQFGCTPDYWVEHGKDHATNQVDIYLEAH